MYKVNIQNKELQMLDQVKFEDVGLKERADIQEWLSKSPHIFGIEENSLLILSKELPVSGRDERGIRLDLLALDRDGRLVVIELKRDEGKGVEWQAIKYAARCYKFSTERIIQLLSEYESCSEDEAKIKIIEHIEGEQTTNDSFDDLFSYNSNHSGIITRIILVARKFHPDVCAAVEWLRDNNIDISCIKIKPYRNENGDIYLTTERIIPLPEMTDYTEFKRLISHNNQLTKNESNRTIYSDSTSEMNNDELKNNLKATLTRNSILTPRLIEFLKILSDGKSHGREEIRDKLKDNTSFGAQGDLGQAGRLLSNISQFITKPASGHLRLLIEYSGKDNLFQAGQEKTSYCVRKEYIELLKAVLAEILVT